VRVLIEGGADVNLSHEQVCYIGLLQTEETALHVACIFKHLEVMRVLVREGNANPNYSDMVTVWRLMAEWKAAAACCS
jgi:hypothetical protein